MSYYTEIDKMQETEFYDTILKSCQLTYKIKKGIINESDLNEQDNIRYIMFNDLELNLGNPCSLACKYCYLDKFGDKLGDDGLYPTKDYNDNTHLNNIEKYLKFLIKNNQALNTIELYGGDPLFRSIGFKVLDLIYEIYNKVDKQYRPNTIVIPSNMTWIQFDKKVDKFEELYSKYNDIGIRLIISISFDGILENENRPLVNPHMDKVINRDDKYIDKLFTFQKKYHCGFHPMIYSNQIEQWIDNFIWFQGMFKKYDISPFQLYLLEVRNAEWNKSQIIEMGIFMRFLVKYYLKYFQNNNPYQAQKMIFQNKLDFNILTHGFSSIGRGIGCSLQTTTQLNTSDLSISACHRNNYKYTQGYILNIDDNLNLSITQNNYEYISILSSFNVANQPYCESCSIKYMCPGLCPGSQLETFGDPFIPIPSTCMMEHMKFAGLIYTMQETGILSYYNPSYNNNFYYMRQYNNLGQNMIFNYLDFISQNNLSQIVKLKDDRIINILDRG